MGSGPGQHRINHVGNRQQLRKNKKHMLRARPPKYAAHQGKNPQTRRREW